MADGTERGNRGAGRETVTVRATVCSTALTRTDLREEIEWKEAGATFTILNA